MNQDDRIRSLRRAAPGLLGRGIAVVEADQVDMLEVDKFQALRVLDPAAEDEVKLAHARLASIKCGCCEPVLRRAQSFGPRMADTAALPLVRAASLSPSTRD